MFPAGGNAYRYHAARNVTRSGVTTTAAIRTPIRSYTTSITSRFPLLQTCRSQGSGAAATKSLLVSSSPLPRTFHTSRVLAQRFSPLVPPPPSSLPKAQAAKQYKRTRKWLRRLFYLAVLVGGAHLTDRYFLYSSLTRSARTFALAIIVATDYKINFREHPPFAESIEALHARNAEKLFNLLHTNGGLYLKIGQAIAMQSAVLPPQFQKMFSRMFDDAPQNSWADVVKVIQEDFGKTPEELFGVSFTGEPGKGMMERVAKASASVAQVHWARLPDGREVAIKIQKREIAQQVGWDLWSFKVVSWVYTWYFDIPMYSLVPYITERLMLETDFQNEADNAERMEKLVKGEPRLRDRVYIPKVYRELSSKRVMTAEWIEGVRLWDKAKITAKWQGGWRKGSPGACGSRLELPRKSAAANISSTHTIGEQLKPHRDEWEGKNHKGGLGLPLREVMQTMVDLFSAQMFLFGVVHCDPHPGNIFIRRTPAGRTELVLLDHGLYVYMDPDFRHKYALLWKSLMTFDNKTIKEVVNSWGVGNPDLFASATLLRPYSGGDKSVSESIRKGLEGKTESERAYEMQQKMRAGMKQMLLDQEKFPRELLFIGRNLRIVQGNNQYMGSPVNRVKLTGMWASRALTESPDLTFGERIKYFGSHLVFRTVLFSSDLYFWYTKVRQWLGIGGGMEDEIEAQMRNMAKGFGVELQHDVFQG